MNISILGRIFIVLCAFLPTAANRLETNSPTIAGHVLYKDGTPVKDADVEIHFYGPTGAILPEAKTDKNGYFSIAAPPYGDGVVSASKVSEGYPNAALAFYGRTGYTSMQRVNIRDTTVIDNIELRFGEPDATIAFTIQAADTHENVSNARVQIALSSQPDISGSYSVSKEGRFSFVLPKSPVLVKITALGFADWSYAGQSGKGNALLMKPGTNQQIVVLLNRLK
jgi:hypothetical protein